MKRLLHICAVIIMLISLTACGKNMAETPLEELPSDLSLSDVKKAGYVVHEDGDITDGEKSGRSFWLR